MSKVSSPGVSQLSAHGRRAIEVRNSRSASESSSGIAGSARSLRQRSRRLPGAPGAGQPLKREAGELDQFVVLEAAEIDRAGQR